MAYFITPNYSVAFNAKVASSTLARAIIEKFYPDKETLIQNSAYPAHIGPNSVRWHFLCPTEQHASRPIVLIVRDPVSRFCSAMAQLNLIDVENTLTALEQDTEEQLGRRNIRLTQDAHFRHQHELLQGGIAFKLKNLTAAAAYIDLNLPLPVINAAKRLVPTLTTAQKTRVLTYYAADSALYDSAQ